MTEEQRSLSRRYIVYQVLSNVWLTSAVWLYFYRLFITDQQIGLLDGLAFAIGLLAEVPSGALADRFGRDKLVKIGQLLAGSGLILQAFGSSFAVFCIGQAIVMVGAAFASGADDALFFEKLQFERSSTSWRKLVTRGSQATLVASLFAITLGGWLHTINPRLPWALTGLIFIASAFAIWTLKESRPRHTASLRTEVASHLNMIRSGFMQFLTPKLLLYIPIILIVQGLFYTAGWGLLRIILLDRFYFSPFAGSIVVAVSGLVTVGILSFMHHHAERLHEKHVITLFSLGAAFALLGAVPDIGWWGAGIIMIIYAGEHLLHPFMSEVCNNAAPSSDRATVLSVASFLRTLPYVILAPVIGYLNTQGHLEYFLIPWAVLIIIALIMYLSTKKRDELIRISTN